MSENNQSKRSRCRYCFPPVSEKCNEFQCAVNGWEDENIKNVSCEDCENCDKFSSRYIEYPITVNGIESEKIKSYDLSCECGTLCEIKPCGEEYENKSYLGIYLGELPISIATSYDKDTGVLKNRAVNRGKTMKKKALNFNTRKNAIIIGSASSGKCHHPWDDLKPCPCGCKKKPLLMYEKDKLYYCGGTTENVFAICSICGRHTEKTDMITAINNWNNDKTKKY